MDVANAQLNHYTDNFKVSVIALVGSSFDIPVLSIVKILRDSFIYICVDTWYGRNQTARQLG